MNLLKFLHNILEEWREIGEKGEELEKNWKNILENKIIK